MFGARCSGAQEVRVLEFVKHTGMECPNTQLMSYCNKIAEVMHNEKLLVYFFQDSLISSMLNWYMTLDNTRIKK
jgi:hypothetical protein